MRILLSILFFVALVQSSFGSSTVIDDRTLTEMLFKGQPGTIFTCKILTMTAQKYNNETPMTTSDGSILSRDVIQSFDGGMNGTATAEIIQVYFGKVDTNIVTLNTWTFFQVDKTFLIYASENGKIFNYDSRTKEVAGNPDSIYELRLLKQFSEIFKSKMTGQFTFTNSKSIIVAEGQYIKGKPIKIWKHYYDSGTIKANYDLKRNIILQYSSNGYIKSSATQTKEKSVYLFYSDKINNRIKYKSEEFPNDSGFVMTSYSYFENGNLEKKEGQININVQGGSASSGRTGIYEEYYENGRLKLKGQYGHNRRIGLWKWYYENGEFNAEFDYKDGTGNQ
ncbi:MAG: toxin-antitoxin system YwqK family antitoxin [Bacteroidota bacterium]